VTFEHAIMGDFIIVRSDGTPTYNFANVIDDALMEITHVIRGDDHLSNTPRQVLLYRALNFDLPVFAHIPMILGPDGAKLSKRHGAQSLTYYRNQGYYSWAVVNYLALLGWSTSESQQFFQRDELIRAFSLERVNKSAAVFDIQKLDSMNAHYIREMDIDELKAHLLPYLELRGWVKGEAEKRDEARLTRIIELARERIRRFSDIAEVVGFFFEPDFCYDEKAVEKRLLNAYAMTVLQEVRQNVAAAQTLTEGDFEDLLRNLSKQLELTTSKVFHAVRVALTGKMTGPGLFELAVVLGKEEVVRRLTRTIRLLKNKEILTAGIPH
jgi:glutamyl-tRNA synthetase